MMWRHAAAVGAAMMLATGCAVRAPAPVNVPRASEHAAISSSAPSSQPSGIDTPAPADAGPASQPTVVVMSRERFDQMAAAVTRNYATKDLALSECKKSVALARADDDAAAATIERQAAQMRMVMILGPVGVVVVTAIAVAIARAVPK